ncbi:MAG: 1-(5-phosphoribosyl)-5-[(5-phosphoribosylamino)methylideneamino]imidazole-4-carboxamide isomerase [Nitrospirae bacterium RIFCSPLOWO2_02_FULL_62_14]|nr:MAG: 1-(5-phosphoribosyl)-5-[(5-phosphoribosylamino)methylideneamino]imidazole-4-carboxamide isomerase [Nitrospirae bacterium RIFCSPLOWO2_02_FULL_62_14]OGW66871.1 MAG: 1-(5-phosphoribosyl)-5-[(5-phosphoribosylamino)methylideneamino]imidazole-4-carboxamide isomerase [Nitrospirae bacterium RIFCSPLOWO2_01_FULL_62_17]OGX05310.1 MAG: 1-(5-phosphoribosyl)-5-[(5-phosphoribosylamino)methylideneamino]imidazole-4-carboxamide isomerase [Nitrospirae bacterium RIFCSPLOWO2_12_FULL_63_8]
MLIIPAIDLKDGQCVRLMQGNMHQATVYSDDPAAMARQWQDQGAQLLHVVDLNGAFEGEPKNLAQVEGIVNAVSIPVQVGGGIRSLDTVRMYLGAGAKRVVMGTTALRHRNVVEEILEVFPERVVVSIDAKNGLVATDGWKTVTSVTARDAIASLSGLALAAVMYTDIAKDGMMAGPNMLSLQIIVEASPVPVIASGGVSNLEDIKAIKALGPKVEGVILGKALYEGKIDLKQAIAAAQAEG